MITKEFTIQPPIKYEVEKLLPQGENILANFPVYLLEREVSDPTITEVFITPILFILRHDKRLEIYELAKMEIYTLGDKPKFELFGQILEPRYTIFSADAGNIKNLLSDENILRLTFNEVGERPKSLVLRDRAYNAKDYQTWAMYQILLNQKNKVPSDPVLFEMVSGNFSKFNEKAIITMFAGFLGIIIVYMLVSVIFDGALDTIMTILFGVIISVALGWTITSLNKNNKRFYNTFLRYSPESLNDLRRTPENTTVNHTNRSTGDITVNNVNRGPEITEKSSNSLGKNQ